MILLNPEKKDCEKLRGENSSRDLEVCAKEENATFLSAEWSAGNASWPKPFYILRDKIPTRTLSVQALDAFKKTPKR